MFFNNSPFIFKLNKITDRKREVTSPLLYPAKSANMILLNKIEPISGRKKSSYYVIAILGLLIFPFTNVQSQCSGNFYDHAGSSTNYGNNRNDVTTFTATSGSNMKVQFTAFITESGYDKLYVYDGVNTSAVLIHTLSGTTIPNDIISSGQSLTFKFTSDGSVNFSGWAATLSCVAACSNITSAGTITGNESQCGSYDPANITNTTSPSGGSGTLQYQWQSNTTGTWNNITSATSSTYNPGVITVTTQYRRQAKRSTCTAYLTSNVIVKTVYASSDITLSNVNVSSCINHPLQDIASVSVQVAWATQPASKIAVKIGTKTEYINVAGGATSPQTVTFLVPADAVSQSITAQWDQTNACVKSINFTAPAACSSDQLSCNILYLCGLDKPYDGDPFDHGLINYIASVNSGSLLPSLTKADGSGLGLYDPINTNTPLSIDINNYSLIVVSPTTEGHISQDLKNALESFTGSILNMNYDIQDDLGTIIGNGTYRWGDYGYTTATTQKTIYNYDNPTAYAGTLITGGNPKTGSTNSLWYNSGDANGSTNVARYIFNAHTLPGVSSTHGNRVFLGYHMNGIYGNPTNGGALPAPVSSYFAPTKHLTIDGKLILDQALVEAAKCGIEICDNGIDDDGDGLTDCADPDCSEVVNREFDQNDSYWNLFLNDPSAAATLSIDNTSKISGKNSAKIDITSSSSVPGHIEFMQFDLALVAGKTYEFSYQVKANNTRTIEATIDLGVSPFTNYFSSTDNITTSTATYTHTFVAPISTNNGRILFKLAGSTTIIWLDNVQLKESCTQIEICPERVSNGVIAFYNFKELTGNTIHDVSGYGTPENLVIQNPSNVTWNSGCGLSVNSNTTIKTTGATTKIVPTLKASNAFTFEAWIKSDNSSQNGPARIATISGDQNNRNFTLGQEGSKYAIRSRTSDGSTTVNGLPEIQTGIVSSNNMQHLLYAWDGSTNIEKIFLDGSEIYSGTRLGNISNWDNSYAFALANELTNDRSWLGDIYMVALYNRALSSAEVMQNYLVGGCCDGNGPPNGLLFECQDGKSIDMNYAGIKNNIPINFNVGSTTDVDSILVEIVYKTSNPGATITIQDDASNSYTASRNSVGIGAFVYSFILPPTTTINYTNTTNQIDAQSLTAYKFKSNQIGSSYLSQFTTIGGYANTQTIGYIVPSRTDTQDIVIKLPVSEITYDDRTLTFNATIGSITETITKQWGPNGLNFPNGCCIDEVEIILEDVPPTQNSLTIDVVSPSGTGQSYVIAGLVFVEIKCFDEICDNGIDDDGDGLIDCADPDCSNITSCIEICDNGIDDDGDGLIDCADPDCTTPGNADVVTSQTGVDNPNNALNAPDGIYAEVYDATDVITLDLTDVISAGNTYTLTWRRKSTYTNTATADIVIEESSDGSNFTTNPTLASTNNRVNFINTIITANVNTRYIRLKEQTGTDDDFDLDAVSYSISCAFEICDNGIDDDGDGLIDCADPDCSNITSCIEICDNGIDDDGDGLIDGADPDCAPIPSTCDYHASSADNVSNLTYNNDVYGTGVDATNDLSGGGTTLMDGSSFWVQPGGLFKVIRTTSGADYSSDGDGYFLFGKGEDACWRLPISGLLEGCSYTISFDVASWSPSLGTPIDVGVAIDVVNSNQSVSHFYGSTPAGCIAFNGYYNDLGDNESCSNVPSGNSQSGYFYDAGWGDITNGVAGNLSSSNALNWKRITYTFTIQDDNSILYLSKLGGGLNSGLAIDNLCLVNEGCVEICDNGIDDDGDGLIDSADPDCPIIETCSCNSTNLFTNPGFESGTYNGTTFFISGQNGDDLGYNWGTPSGLAGWSHGPLWWLDAPIVASEGNKMVYINNATGGSVCQGQYFDIGTGVGQISECATYQLCFDWASFNRENPNGRTTTSQPAIDFTWFDNAGNEVGVTHESLGTPVGNQNWDNIIWSSVSFQFSLTGAHTPPAGATNVRVNISEQSGQDNGLLIDNANLCVSSPCIDIFDNEVCYFISDGESSGADVQDTLYTFNYLTSTVTPIGPTGTYKIESMAMDTLNNIVYAIDGDKFGIINISTGQFTQLSSDVASSLNGAEGIIDIDDIDGMTFDHVNNIIWATERRDSGIDGAPDDLLIKINPITGLAIQDGFGSGIGYLVINTPEHDIDDIAISEDGTLYAISNYGGSGNQAFGIINKTTGAWTEIGDYGIEDVESLAFTATGQLVATTGKDGNDRNQLYTIDAGTGVATYVGSVLPGHDVEACDCMSGKLINLQIGDKVWADINEDGIQDLEEPGIAGVVVNLLTNSGSPYLTNGNPTSTVTNNFGIYNFDGLPTGQYIVEFVLPGGGESFSPQNIGGDDTKDSDANTSTGRTQIVTLSGSTNNLSLDAGLLNANAVVRDCSNDGELFVIDGGGTIKRYNQNTGALIGDFIQGLAGPIEMIVGPDDWLWVSNSDSDEVRKYSLKTGVLIQTIKGDLKDPHGLTVGPDGNIYVNNDDYDEVVKIDIATGATSKFTVGGAGGLDGNKWGLEFGPDGNLYVTSFYTDQVLRYNGTTGAFMDVFIASNSSILNGPSDITFGPDGHLYVSGKHTDNVVKYNGTTGAHMSTFVAYQSGGLKEPVHLQFGEDGFLYVSSQNMSIGVLKYNGTTGAIVGNFAYTASPEGILFAPVPTIIEATISATDIDVCATQSSTLTVNVSAGQPPFNYQWNEGLGTSNTVTVSPIYNTEYIVTITDANGCIGSNSISIINSCPPAPQGQICFNGTNGISATANYNYILSATPTDDKVKIRVTYSTNFVDNTYGSTAIGWANGQDFGNLVGSDKMTIALYDSLGVKKVQFAMDYISDDNNAPSGYSCLGINGGGGGMELGNASDILNTKSSLSVNLNDYGYVLTTNSPATDHFYTPNPTYPNWIYDVWYEFEVKLSAFGSEGFGSMAITEIHASPSKTGNNTEIVTEGPCCELLVTIQGDSLICGSELVTLSPTFAQSNKTAYLTVVDDTYLVQNKPSNNFSACNKLVVDTEPGKLSRAMVKFDLSNYPTGATFVKATLSMPMKGGDNNSMDIGVHKVLKDWFLTSSAECDNSLSPNWNQSYTGVNWTNIGGDFNPAPIVVTSVQGNADYYWDVSNVVEDWINGNTNNYGFLLKAVNENLNLRKEFGSLENQLKPKLILEYTEAPNSNNLSYEWNNGLHSPSINVSPSNTTSYSVTVSELGGCIGNDTLEVEVVNIGNPSFNGPDTICVGGVTSISSNSPYVIWTSSDPTIASIDENGSIVGISGGSITFIATDTISGCSSSQSPSLVVRPILNITIENNGSLCFEENSQLTANATGGSGIYAYAWSGPNSFTANTKIITIPDNGTYTVTVTSGNCIAENSKLIYEEYTIDITSVSTTVCEGTPVDLTANSVNAVSYLWSANAGSNTTSIATVFPNPPSSTYGVTVTSNQGCTANASITIGAIPKPTYVLNGPDSICIGATTQLDASTIGIWTALNPGIAAINNSGLVTGLSAGSARFIFTSSATNCQSDTTTVIQINGKPTIALIGPSTICKSSTTQLTPTSGGTWVSSNPTIATVNNEGLVTGIKAGTAYFTFTDSNTGCNSNPSTTVTIEQGNGAMITGPIAICEGNTGQLIVDHHSGSWESLNPSIATVNNTGLVTAISEGIAQIQYNNGTGSCSYAAIHTITVVKTPNVTYTSMHTSCGTNNGSITLSFPDHPTRTHIKLSINDGVTYTSVPDASGSYTFDNLANGTYKLFAKWSNDDCNIYLGQVVLIESNPAPQTVITHVDEACGTSTGGSISFAITDDPSKTQLYISLDAGSTWPYTTLDNVGTYTINSLAPGMYSIATKWNDGSCNKIVGSVQILSGYANVGNISPNDTICYGQSKVITASGGSSYVWSHGPTTASITVSPQTTTSYSVSVYQSNGCFSVKNTSVMVIDPIGVNMNFQGGLCLTDTSKIIALHNGGLAPFQYTWAGPSGPAGTSKTININEGGNYYVTVTDSKGCSATTSGFIYQKYEPFIVNLQTAVCEGTSVDLNVNATDPIAYQWSSNAGSATTSFVTVTPTVPSSTYYVTVTNNIGCEAVVMASIDVNSAPTVSLTGSNEICVGGNTQLSPSSGGYWVSSNQNVAQVNNSGVVTGISGGTADFYYTEQTNNCTSLNPIQITVISDGIQGFSDSELCIGDTTYLSPNTGGVWTATNTNSFSVTPSGMVIALEAGLGKFKYTLNGSGCIATTYGDITVNPKPQPNIEGGSDICIGTTTYITPSSGGVWTSNNPSVASIDQYGTITGLAIGSATFTFVNDLTGCISDDSAPVNVSNNPIPIVYGPNDLCVGTTTSLLPNTGGVWQSTNTSVASVTSNGIVNGIYPGEARFIFVADGGLCISDTSEVVTVLNKPTITLNGDNSICIGETTSFSPSTGGTWTSSNPEVATINDSGVVTGVSAGMVNFAYQNATTTCISDPSTNITIYGNPVVTLTGVDSICIGSVTTLSPTSGGVWTSSNNAIAIISSSGIVTGMSAGNATFTYKENQNDCTSSASTPITILPRPSVQITGPTEICQGSTTTLSPTSGGNWTSNNTSVATVSMAGVVTGVSQGIARFTFVSDFGCSSNQTAPILVNGKPNPVFMSTPSICIGSNINLLPNSGGTWTSSNPAIATINNSGVISAVSAGVVTFTFTDTNTGCISNASGQLTVNAKPAISILPGSRLCVGANMSVSPSVGGAWTSSNTNIATITNSGVVTGKSAGSVTFQFQNAPTGCISDISNPVIVDAKPIISLNGSSPICVGDTTYMTPSTGGTWISNNPTVASINNSGVIIGQLGGVAKFRFTSAQNCASDLSNPIVINSSPTVGLLGPQFICIGSETNVFPSIGGYWTSSNPAIATITNSGLVTGHTEGVVYLTYTDAITGCKSNGNLHVSIMAPPTLTLDGDSDICIGYTTKATASTTGYWISSDTRIASISNHGVITGVAPGVAEFTFIDELTGCPNDGTGIMITVGKCLNPDFNVTLLNTIVNGDLSTNDLTPQNGLYNAFAISKSKPAGSIYTLNINTDGTYNFSANKVGKYTFDIQVCIPPIDFGCPTSLLEITVIGDVHSSNIPINNLEFVTTFANDNTSLAGDNVAFNSMSNDACVSGLGCNLGATNTSIVTPTTNGTNTYIGSGDFSYTPGIGHLGKDVMTYKVCSDIDPTNCSTSSTYITIASKTANNSVVAPDDFNYTVSGTPISGNVKDNDTDPEGDILSVQPMGSVSSPITISGGSYYIDANGDYTFTPNEYFNGPTSFVYTVCDDNVASVCMDATVHLIVIGDLTVSVKFYLEGALMNNGGINSSTGNPLMRDNLRKSPFNGNNYIPITDPYTTGTGLFGHGVKSHMGPGLLSVNQTIQDSASVFGVTGENAIVDWVFLDLRSKTDKTLCIATRSALLQRDGDVVELDGVSPVRFNGIGVDSFYLGVSHRTHLGVMSGLVSNTTSVDFTNQNTVTHNFGLYANTGFNYTGLTFNKNVKTGYNALWAGDFNSNGKVGFVGGDDDSNVIITDVLLFPDNIELKANYDFAYGYFNGDYDMNSKVKFTNPSDDTNMLFTQVLLYTLNQAFASNFGAMIQQVPQRSN